MGITLKLGTYTQLDMTSFDPVSEDPGSADITFFSPTKIIGYINGTSVTIKGSGFKAGSDGYLLPTGTINSVTQSGALSDFSLSGLSLSVKRMVDVLRTPNTFDERDLIKQTMSGADKVYGSDYSDVLVGHGGNDTIEGRGSNDRVFGNAGNDKLNGGAGADKLVGGSGADTFIFSRVSHSTASSVGRDKIDDFSRKDGDKIDLHLIDATTRHSGNQAFKFIGDDEFHKKSGELRYDKRGSDTFIYGDVNGDGKADFGIHLNVAISLKSGDFLL